jgi:hypothetical protein
MTVSAFVPVTAENVHGIRTLLRKNGGYLLTIWSALNWQYTITLYDRPVIRLKPRVAISNRHVGGNDSNPLDDREYRFGKKTEKKGPQLLFESFEGEVYRLGIAAEWEGVNWPNFDHGKYFYVPSFEHLPEAFKYLFEEVLAPHDPLLPETDVEGMIAYIMSDLDTKEVVRRIVRAGMEADAACGFV